MLVLTRKQNEDILIGDSIVVKVVGIYRNQVKIGIEAGSEIKIYRKEVYDSVKKSNVEAVRTERAQAEKLSKLFSEKTVISLPLSSATVSQTTKQKKG